MGLRHELATLWEHTYLLLSHVHPGTVHTNTSTCLLCRHRYAARAQTSPSFVQFALAKRYPSENELLSTDHFQPKIFACLVRSDVVSAQVSHALNQLHYFQAHTTYTHVRAKNVVLALDDYSIPPSVGTLTQNAFSTCRNLVVLGVGGDLTSWSKFTEEVRHTLNQNPGVAERALLLLLPDAGILKNFLAWLGESGGRISQRTLVNNHYLAFDVWTSGDSAWDIPFFV